MSTSGSTIWELGNLTRSTEILFYGLKAFEEAGERKPSAAPITILEIIYNEMGKNDEALKNHRAALKNTHRRTTTNRHCRFQAQYRSYPFRQATYTEALNNFL
jgi:hypothetical protein